jgi:gamma-glutamylaminecyclotransferase
MTKGGSGRVYGEVYEVTPEVLQALDELEGHPDWYQRTLIALVRFRNPRPLDVVRV